MATPSTFFAIQGRTITFAKRTELHKHFLLAKRYDLFVEPMECYLASIEHEDREGIMRHIECAREIPLLITALIMKKKNILIWVLENNGMNFSFIDSVELLAKAVLLLSEHSNILTNLANYLNRQTEKLKVRRLPDLLVRGVSIRFKKNVFQNVTTFLRNINVGEEAIKMIKRMVQILTSRYPKINALKAEIKKLEEDDQNLNKAIRKYEQIIDEFDKRRGQDTVNQIIAANDEENDETDNMNDSDSDNAEIKTTMEESIAELKETALLDRYHLDDNQRAIIASLQPFNHEGVPMTDLTRGLTSHFATTVRQNIIRVAMRISSLSSRLKTLREKQTISQLARRFIDTQVRQINEVSIFVRAIWPDVLQEIADSTNPELGRGFTFENFDPDTEVELVEEEPEEGTRRIVQVGGFRYLLGKETNIGLRLLYAEKRIFPRVYVPHAEGERGIYWVEGKTYTPHEILKHLIRMGYRTCKYALTGVLDPEETIYHYGDQDLIPLFTEDPLEIAFCPDVRVDKTSYPKEFMINVYAKYIAASSLSDFPKGGARVYKETGVALPFFSRFDTSPSDYTLQFYEDCKLILNEIITQGSFTDKHGPFVFNINRTNYTQQRLFVDLRFGSEYQDYVDTIRLQARGWSEIIREILNGNIDFTDTAKCTFILENFNRFGVSTSDVTTTSLYVLWRLSKMQERSKFIKAVIKSDTTGFYKRILKR